MPVTPPSTSRLWARCEPMPALRRAGAGMVAAYGDEMASGAIVGRTLGNLVRTPLQIALVGTARLQRPETAWRRALSMGALGLAQVALDRGANAAAAGVSHVLRRCFVPSGVAEAAADGVNLALYTSFGLPLHAALAAAPLVGRAFAYGATASGILAGLTCAALCKNPARLVQFCLGIDASKKRAAGAGKVSNFDAARLQTMADEAARRVSAQLPCKPDWNRVTLHSLSSAQMKIGMLQNGNKNFVEKAAQAALDVTLRLGMQAGNSIALSAGNLWGHPLEAAQQVMDHEMVHAWQSAHYPQALRRLATSEASDAQRMWVEGHACFYEREGRSPLQWAPSKLQKLAAWARGLDLDLVPRADANAPYITAPEIFVKLHHNSHLFDAQTVERKVFENPELMRVLFSKAREVRVTLPGSLAEGHERALVDYLWRLNPYRQNHTLHVASEADVRG